MPRPTLFAAGAANGRRPFQVRQMQRTRQKGVAMRKPALWMSLPSARKAAQRARRRVGKVKPSQNRRKPVRRVSAKRAQQNRAYAKLRVAFLAANPFCQACVPLFGARFPADSKELHHRAGRRGELLCHIPGFVAMCSDCHRFCHEHPGLARSAGLLAPIGKWNSQRDVSTQQTQLLGPQP